MSLRRPSTAPATTNGQRKRAHSGLLTNATSTAAASAARPTHPPQSPNRLSIALALPSSNLHGHQRQEKSHDRHVEVKDEVLGVENALREALVVLQDAQVAEKAAPDAARGVGVPPEHPKQKENEKRATGGQDRVPRE